MGNSREGNGKDVAIGGGEAVQRGFGEVFLHAGDVVANHVEAVFIQLSAGGIGPAVEQVRADAAVQLLPQGGVVLGGSGGLEDDFHASQLFVLRQQGIHLLRVVGPPGTHGQFAIRQRHDGQQRHQGSQGNSQQFLHVENPP